MTVNLDYFGGRNITVSQVLHKHFFSYKIFSETTHLWLMVLLEF